MRGKRLAAHSTVSGDRRIQNATALRELIDEYNYISSIEINGQMIQVEKFLGIDLKWLNQIIDLHHRSHVPERYDVFKSHLSDLLSI